MIQTCHNPLPTYPKQRSEHPSTRTLQQKQLRSSPLGSFTIIHDLSHRNDHDSTDRYPTRTASDRNPVKGSLSRSLYHQPQKLAAPANVCSSCIDARKQTVRPGVSNRRISRPKRGKLSRKPATLAERVWERCLSNCRGFCDEDLLRSAPARRWLQYVCLRVASFECETSDLRNAMLRKSCSRRN